MNTNPDGAFPFDSQIATIGGKQFILEEFSPVEGSIWAQSNAVDGSPRGGRDTRTVITASCTAQYPSGATLADTPALFAVVPLQYRGASKNFVITEVGVPQRAGQETKVALKLREQINAPGGGS